jgi:hypothetical protein
MGLNRRQQSQQYVRIVFPFPPNLKMPKTICLLSPQEASDLKDGLPVLCKNHRHAGPMAVRQLRYDSYRGSVKPAELPDGKISNTQVCVREAKEWRKTPSRNAAGGSMATMQLVPCNLSRRRAASNHKTKLPHPPQGKSGPIVQIYEPIAQAAN